MKHSFHLYNLKCDNYNQFSFEEIYQPLIQYLSNKDVFTFNTGINYYISSIIKNIKASNLSELILNQ